MTYTPKSSQSQRRNGRIFFFGGDFPKDELADLFRRMLVHAKDRRFRLLGAFIQESTRVLKDELRLLPEFMLDEVPQFESILHLPDHGDFREGCLGAALESALLVVLHIGMFIGHHEGYRLGLESVPTGSIAIGLSTGLLSAAALTTASTLADMVRTGAESMRVAFRLGVYVLDFSQKVETAQPGGGITQSWAYVVHGMSKELVDQELSKFNAQSGVSELSKIFIGAVDKASVGITGPPSRLRAAFEFSQPLRYSNSVPISASNGLYNASETTYTSEDVANILAGTLDEPPTSHTTNISLISSQNGKPFACTTALDLLRSICTELLTGTTDLDKITTATVQHIVNHELSSWSFDTYRTSRTTRYIIDDINTAFHMHTPLEHCDMVLWAFEDYGTRQPATTSDAKLAIVGMACRMPGGANNCDQFWEYLEKGYDARTKVPQERFDSTLGAARDATRIEYGNFIDRPGYFDGGFFAMSPKEVKQTDPMLRLALITGYEAMEMAGIVPGRTTSTKSSRIGTYFDRGDEDWRDFGPFQSIHTALGGARHLKPAVNTACNALWVGDVDTAVVGGANVINDLRCAPGFSKTGQCKVWDKDADDKYCRAEAIGAVVIKRLEDAEADNDNILAVLLSESTNHSADMRSTTRSQAYTQEANYRQVLFRAGVHPFDISFVELHGAGTQAGDVIEAESVLNVFAPSGPRRRCDQPLILGAVKSNIGHGGAAAGISSLIKTLLCFEHDKIPPHIGIKTKINPAIPRDSGRRQVALAGRNTPWPKSSDKKRLAVVNSLSASGVITSLLLEEGPQKPLKVMGNSSSLRSIVISGQSKNSLSANLENVLEYLDQHPDTDLASLSYTLCARRLHHGLRVATTVNSVASLQKFITSTLEKGLSDIRPVSVDRPSVIFVFTGEGSAYTGSPDLFAEFAPFRSQVIQLDSIVKLIGFDSVIPVIDGSAPEEYASHPIVSQLSIVVLEIALARYWVMMGYKPSAVIGHSLGEFSAMVVSGVLSASDALFLVGRRAQLTLEKCVLGSYSMLSLRANPKDIETLLNDNSITTNIAYEIACRNTEKNTVLGGHKNDIAGISSALQAAGYNCVELAMPFAYHTAQMDAVVDDYYNLACSTPFKAPIIPYISSLLAEIVSDDKTIDADYMRRQTRESVNFAGAINAAIKVGTANEKTIWIDIGPHPVCASFIKSIVPGSNALSSCRRKEDTNDTLTKSLVQLHLAGLEPLWTEHFRGREDSHRVLHLPKYSWDEVNYGVTYPGGVL